MRRTLLWVAIGAGCLLVLVVAPVVGFLTFGPPAAPRPSLIVFPTPTGGPAADVPPSPAPVALASPSPISTVPPASPTTVTPSPAPTVPTRERVTVTGTGDDGLNVRSEPSSTAALVKTLPDGDELEVIGPDREADGRTWRNVRDPSDGASGWAAAEFLMPSGGQ